MSTTASIIMSVTSSAVRQTNKQARTAVELFRSLSYIRSKAQINTLGKRAAADLFLINTPTDGCGLASYSLRPLQAERFPQQLQTNRHTTRTPLCHTSRRSQASIFSGDKYAVRSVRKVMWASSAKSTHTHARAPVSESAPLQRDLFLSPSFFTCMRNGQIT